MDQNIQTQAGQPEKARLHRLNLRLTQQEWDKIHRLAANSTCRTTSEYARKVLAQKPVRVFYRNQSFDNFEEQMVRLLPQLQICSNNFATAIQKLETLMPTTEIMTCLHDLHLHADQLSETTKKIKEHLINLSDNETKNNDLQQHSQITLL
ncbi:MAG TPA: hypothetical protein VL727_23220 [Puia sp.]|nr:hypothetical protein [Puia sp.]